MPERFQSYDELSSGGGASPGSIEDATRVAERRARARTRSAAETTYERAQGEVLATPGGTAAARERAPIYEAPARSVRDRLNDAIHYFRNLSSAQFSADAKQFIRQHPESLAGAVVAGFVMGRLLRRL